MEIINNFSDIFLSVWNKGILGVDIFQILIGIGIFLIFLIFRGIISKLIIKNYQLDAFWINTNLMCISEKTSTILNEIKWKKIFLFNPGEEEFLLYKI